MNGKLLIVADLGLVKAYEFTRTARGTPHLTLLERKVFEKAHHRFIEDVTDASGRWGPPTHRNWATPVEDPHNLELETRRRLIRAVAQHIERLSESHEDSDLWLAVPGEFKRSLVGALPNGVRKRVEACLSRDLVKASKDELLKWFPPKEQPGQAKQRRRTARPKARAQLARSS
jgi:hypothetical protein